LGTFPSEVTSKTKNPQTEEATQDPKSKLLKGTPYSGVENSVSTPTPNLPKYTSKRPQRKLTVVTREDVQEVLSNTPGTPIYLGDSRSRSALSRLSIYDDSFSNPDLPRPQKPPHPKPPQNPPKSPLSPHPPQTPLPSHPPKNSQSSSLSLYPNHPDYTNPLLQLTSAGIFYAHLGRSSIIGEMSLEDSLPRNATGIAVDNLELLVIPKKDYKELFAGIITEQRNIKKNLVDNCMPEIKETSKAG
jgi:hypothetical protein